VVCGAAFAQVETSLWYHRLTTADGLSADYNYYVYHDTRGFVWISSIAGLNRFDGQQVKTYHFQPDDSTSLYGENIQSNFFEDRQSNLWFCTYQAVHCYRRKTDNFTHFFIRDSAGNEIKEDYHVFDLESDSILWLRAKDVVYRVYLNDGFRAEPVCQTKDFFLQHFKSDSRDTDYLISWPNKDISGLTVTRISEGKMTSMVRHFEGSQKNQPALIINGSAAVESQSTVWLGSSKGLLKFNPANGSFRLSAPAKGTNLTIASHSDNWLLASIEGHGLWLFNKTSESFSPLTLNDLKSLESEPLPVYQMYLDRSENLWISLPQYGLVYANLRKNKFDVALKPALPQIQAGYDYTCLLEDANQQLWAGTWGGGVLRFRRDKNTKAFLLEKQYFPGETISSIFTDLDGDIWLVTWDKVYRYVGTKDLFMPITDAAPRVKKAFLHGTCLPGGQILICDRITGIYLAKKVDNQWTVANIHQADNIGYGPTYFDESQELYICRNEAEIEIFRMEGEQLKFLRKLLLPGEINGFYQKPNTTTLWIATSFGLAKVDLDKSNVVPIVLTEKNGLPDKYIRAMLPDHLGRLWLSTGKGLALWDPKSSKCQTFTKADGMLSQKFSTRAATQWHTGELIFGGENGLTIVRPEQIRTLQGQARVVITSIQINDETPATLRCFNTGATNPTEIEHLRLPYRDRTVSLSFAAMDYADPKRTQLQYMLESADRSFVLLPAGEPGFARYPNLQPGNYVFKVRGANSDGVWDSQPQDLIHLTILPPFYQTWWFRSLVLLGFVGMVIGIYRYRVNQIQEREQLKTRIVENRMAALRAQMNPHFIFNSLHSINSYILRQDNRNASEYLTQFAKLMRMILEHSRVPTISLEKEVALLEMYMKAEQKRLKFPFTYAIHLDEQIDAYDTMVPSMMLQPFIENSVWHGLSHKESPGHIQLAFYRENRHLKCVVEDNGIGRTKAKELKEQRGTSTHQSRALEITEERLRLMNPGREGEVSIKFFDLFDKDQAPAGTRVEIRFPLPEEK
jgi:ligand-binding sensor domain-containing protein